MVIKLSNDQKSDKKKQKIIKKTADKKTAIKNKIKK